VPWQAFWKKLRSHCVFLCLKAAVLKEGTLKSNQV